MNFRHSQHAFSFLYLGLFGIIVACHRDASLNAKAQAQLRAGPGFNAMLRTLKLGCNSET